MHSSPVLSLSPSFNCHSSAKLTEIAASVIEQFRAESEVGEVFHFKDEEKSSDTVKEHTQVEEVKNKKEEEDDDFEFAFVCRDPDSYSVFADEIFYNGQIRPIFPIFNRDLLSAEAEMDNSNSFKPPTPSSIRLPLRKLLIEDRDTSSCSSSDVDELDGIQPGTYCVWTPKAAAAEESLGRCKKSNSTGSSKKWKFRDLLHRSNSDGKDTFVFLTPSNANAKKKLVDEASKVTGYVKAKGVAGSGEALSATEAHHLKSREMKEADQRRSFLPYRQDLVGFFANVNGLSRNIHPF